MTMTVVGFLALAWLGGMASVVLGFRHALRALWREPMLRYPVLIVESDDWGAGPVGAQAAVLDRLADVLIRHRDRDGRHPVMTLALVLAVPDGPATSAAGAYRRLQLDDPRFGPVRQAIERGRRAGVFALQLHGLEHYWPPALMAAEAPLVGAWLLADQPAETETLPAALQSRWVDASVLPSRPLDPARIDEAVAEEVGLFTRVFGEPPRVAVPPTFVWSAEVERAWAAAGIETVVTPGLRSACRNAEGLPDCDSGPLRNGEAGVGVTYVVRDDYFEPERGHRAESALQALAQKTAEGRPCLLETHRSNFIHDAGVAETALGEIDRLLALAARQVPELRFLSTQELGRILRGNDPEWIETRRFARMIAWGVRIRSVRPFWRWARLTGLAWIIRAATAISRRGW